MRKDYHLFTIELGPTVNICAKINSIASPNGMVIGGDLYEIVNRTFDRNYHFSKVGQYSIDDLGVQYPVYSISSKRRRHAKPI
jgi:class 3 adenylate cyclase